MGMQIHALTARELLAHLERGELSSVEIVEALEARTDAVDARVRGFVHRFREQAREEARRMDELRAKGDIVGPLHGLPITFKENVDTRGVASTLGIRAWRDRVAERDAVTVRLAREAGAIVLGKTNVPQTLLSPIETTNHMWGTTKNPWSGNHASGGSSGGEGAVIGSGQSPWGIGTDIGGSIRSPAAFCGIAGIKPTLHRWSNVGSRGMLPGQETIKSQIGPLARTTADLALLLRALDTPLHHRHDPSAPPAPIGDPDAVDVSKLRIGFYESDGWLEPAASVRRGVLEAVAALEDAGADVVELRPHDAGAVTRLYLAVVSSDGLDTAKRELDGEPIIEPMSVTWQLAKLPAPARRAAARAMRLMGEERLAGVLEETRRRSVMELWDLTAERAAVQVEERRRWEEEGIDALVCPAMPTPPVPLGMAKDFTLSFCYLARYNVLNMPAGVVPVTRVRPDETRRTRVSDRLDRRAAEVEARSEGLPVGVQVVGSHWREDVVLSVMQAIEDRARQSPDFPWTPVS